MESPEAQLLRSAESECDFTELLPSLGISVCAVSILKYTYEMALP